MLRMCWRYARLEIPYQCGNFDDSDGDGDDVVLWWWEMLCLRVAYALLRQQIMWFMFGLRVAYVMHMLRLRSHEKAGAG